MNDCVKHFLKSAGTCLRLSELYYIPYCCDSDVFICIVYVHNKNMQFNFLDTGLRAEIKPHIKWYCRSK